MEFSSQHVCSAASAYQLDEIAIGQASLVAQRERLSQARLATRSCSLPLQCAFLMYAPGDDQHVVQLWMGDWVDYSRCVHSKITRMFLFIAMESADSSLGRLDYTSLSQQALVEMLIDGIRSKK
ncbi:hypothetical protein XU18_0500 [Perkinsela sp. CCAP 1560/4]|nr:hypothetical protein XU18_0500 [Perkinsela sp. CCAP 1560/4]|eukprot:KNH09222.1 hypothetical protein XU18_0500 [Perkinsela sp. CCAP 1560/4]